MAVKSHLTFKPNTYSSQAKGPFEATSYHLFYFAADADDAARRPSSDVSLVLNRSENGIAHFLRAAKRVMNLLGHKILKKLAR